MTKANGVHSTQGPTAPEIPPNIHEPMTQERPAEPVDSRAANLATQERKRERALQRLARLRERASAEIDRLIAFLDASDDYVQTELEPSLGFNAYGCDDREDEPEHAEPSLGWTDTETKRGHYSSSECEVDRSDDEPSLGSPEGIAMNEGRSQEDWAQGRTDDLEDEHDGAEPEDTEPEDDREPGPGPSVVAIEKLRVSRAAKRAAKFSGPDLVA